MNWEKVIDVIQNIMILLLIIVVAVCILVLIAFDTVVGAGSMMFLTNSNVRVSFGISLATSGLLLALMFIGYNMATGRKSGFVKTAGLSLLIGAGVIYLLDVYFDALTADYLRFGKFVALKSLAPEVRNVQILFRALIGGISTFGESLAIAIILGMEVLKGIVADALPKGQRQSQHHQKQQQHQKSTYEPKHRPNWNKSKERTEPDTYVRPTPKPSFTDELTRLFHSDDE